MKALRLAALLVFAGSLCAFAQEPSSPSQQHASQAAQKTWFVRLIPPRPTFDKDMTVGGPALDPRGFYGVLAIAADSEGEARAIASADPSVKAGINKVEVAEMRIAFLPGRSNGQ